MMSTTRQAMLIYLCMTAVMALAVVSGPAVAPVAAKDYWNDETPAERDARMKWWQEARFGMFIHWGLYAVPAGEWKGKTNYAEWIRNRAEIPLKEYDKFVGRFKPVRFDADRWVRMAKRAGMKYVVITSKHHDGFCMWPSELTNYDVDSTPLKIDIMGQLRRACEKEGIRFCMYHSIMDWHHPDYLPRRKWEKDRPVDGADYGRYVKYMKGQLAELVKQYQPGVLWFDGEWEPTWTHEQGKDLYQFVRSLDPNIIINNRVDKGRRGMEGMTEKGEFRGDFGTPEQQIPATGIPGADWETCMTMNGHWGWNKNDKNWKSDKDLIRKLVDIASKGGNFLLNIGPKPDGTFPQQAIDRLEAIGKWMDVNGQAIYGTAACPTGRPTWGRITTKSLDNGNTRLFLHIFDWPADGKIDVAVANKPIKCTLLANNSCAIKAASDPNGLTVTLTGNAPDLICSVVVLDVVGSPQPLKMCARQAKDGSVTLKAQDAEIHNPKDGQAARYESGHGKDNIGYWMDPRAWVEWDVRIDKPGTFDVVAQMGSTTDGPQVRVVIGDQQLTGAARDTGSWDKYATVTLGQITIVKSGPCRLEVHPVKESWKPINLRSITLRPSGSNKGK